jgi:hypothetical protein
MASSDFNDFSTPENIRNMPSGESDFDCED